MTKNKLILITGGHLTPAVAVIDELRKRGYSNLLWVGQKHNQTGNKELSPEYNTIKNLEIPFINLKSGKIIRSTQFVDFFYILKNYILILIGLFSSIYIILKYRPNIVLSFGGYIAVPVVISAKIFRVKVVTHEQTLVVGLANKIISKFADKVLVSWDSSKKFFDPKKTVLTGNPIRRDIFIIKSNEITKDFDTNFPTLLIYGGNQGSHEINKRLFPIIEKLLPDCNIIHQTGNSTLTNDFKKAMELRDGLPNELKEKYVVRDYIGRENVGEVLNKSDLIFGRSGANNVSEILALGKLSILVPIPWSSHNEQELNAKYVVDTGLGYLLKQTDSLSSETVFQTIILGLNQLKTGKGFNGRQITECREIAKSKIILEAHQNVVKEIEKILD